MIKSIYNYIFLLLVNIFYASISIALKYTAIQKPLSKTYFLGYFFVIALLGIYAIIWQQILKRIQLSVAYMFKGTSIVFIMLFMSLIYNEPIYANNIIGILFIVFGIALFAKS